MIVAVVDCGTNTFHLLIASDEQPQKILYKKNLAVKLGQGGIAGHIITDEAFKRGIEALKEFSQVIDKIRPDKVVAYGTAALRKAQNGNVLFWKQEQDRYRNSTDDGLKEAELIYHGCDNALTEEDSDNGYWRAVWNLLPTEILFSTD